MALGNQALLRELGIEAAALMERAEELRREGQTVMFVAVDGKPAGLLGVADPIKETTPQAIELLRAEKIHLVMLTGDSRTTAEAVARRLGITDVKADPIIASAAMTFSSVSVIASALRLGRLDI